MKQFLVNISEVPLSIRSFDSALSFNPFSDFLKQRVSAEETVVKSRLYNFIIQKFDQYPELKLSVDVGMVNEYKDMLELIYSGMTGITGEEIYWALATPEAGSVFYGTDPFYDLIAAAKPEAVNDDAANQNGNKNLQLSFIYSFILENLYDYKSLVKAEIVQPFTETGTGVMKYFKMNINSTFVKAEVKGELPKLNFTELETHVNNNTLLSYLIKVLPLSLFSFRGFTVITFYDHTEEYVVKKIKDSIVDSNINPKDTSGIIQALKTLAGDTQIEFRLIPFVKLNDKFLSDYNETIVSQPVLEKMMNDFQKKAKPIFLEKIEGDNELITDLQKAKVSSYALLPLLHNNQLSGALEIYTEKKDLLNEKIISRIDTALPHLAQFMKYSCDDFNSKIMSIVYGHFTSIQSSVQWKFNQAAWHYLQAKDKMETEQLISGDETELEIIDFKNVFPLYGSIDIRNFSLARNKALLDALIIHISLLAETFLELKKCYSENPSKENSSIDKIISECSVWLGKLNETFDENEKQKLNIFHDKEAMPLLLQLRNTTKEYASIIDKYLNELNEKTGRINENRRNLEKSLRMITRAVSKYLEGMNEEFQKTYPCYFDKFRSDGIEYDLYIGDSITNNKSFEPSHLKTLRLQQIKSMAAIDKIANRLLKTMPNELHTTYLIFINGEPIDIYFRNDEKRFDVEGTYNIRYQMIKKRIDKVHLLNSEERLTQPGKIAFVYLNQADADEYTGYIKTLQDEKILSNDLEHLELEELQGVQNLKAMRVGINLNNIS